MVYLALVSFVWAFSFTLIKEYLAGVDPFFASWLRLIISLLVFIPFFRPSALKRKEWIALLAIGAVQYGLMYVCYFGAFAYLRAYEVALFTIVTPVWVVLLADVFEGRLNARYLCSALLAIAGAGVISFQSESFEFFWKGFGLVQLSNLCFAFGQVRYRNIVRDRSVGWQLHVFALLYMGGVLVAGIGYAVSTHSISLIPLSQSQIGVFVFLGIVSSALCFFAWNLGATKVNLGKLAVFNNLKVPLAMFVSIISLGETYSLPKLLGGSLLFVMAFMMSGKGREQLSF